MIKYIWQIFVIEYCHRNKIVKCIIIDDIDISMTEQRFDSDSIFLE